MANSDRRDLIKGIIVGGATFAVPSLLHPSTGKAQGISSLEIAWPDRPVRFIVPLAPGGGLDFIARLVGEYMSRAISQQVFVENRTGAGGTIGIDTAIKSSPDGYSVLLTNDNVASAPHVLRLNVDYVKDLVPVVLLARQPLCLATHPSLGVNSVAELIRAAKEQVGLGCATSGAGSNQHVLLEWFNQKAGVKLAHVPYRGAGQAINDLVAGHVKVAFLGPTALLPHYQAGILRILAQSSEVRSPSLEKIPTLQEAGLTGVVLDGWYAAFVPAGTPSAIVGRLNAEMNKALEDAVIRESLIKTATDPVGGIAQKLALFAKAESDKYAQLIKEFNIKAG